MVIVDNLVLVLVLSMLRLWIFVLVGSGDFAMPLWAGKDPPLVAPPTYTNPAGGGVGGEATGELRYTALPPTHTH